jgi:hypothetical protein
MKQGKMNKKRARNEAGLKQRKRAKERRMTETQGRKISVFATPDCCNPLLSEQSLQQPPALLSATFHRHLQLLIPNLSEQLSGWIPQGMFFTIGSHP